MPFPQPGPSTTLLISGLKAQPRHSGFALQRSLLSAKAATGECLAKRRRDMNHNIYVAKKTSK